MDPNSRAASAAIQIDLVITGGDDDDSACRAAKQGPKLVTPSPSELFPPPALPWRPNPFSSDMIDKARSKFAVNPERGISFLLANDLIEDNPKEIASFLLHCSFLDRAKIGEYLSDPRHTQVLECYLNLIPMADQPLETCLRALLMRFKIPGEAQLIDRLLEAFASYYHQCNPKKFATSDPVYILAFSMILLNTDLHNPNNPCRMSKDVFITSNRSLEGAAEITEKALSEIYDSIAKHELTVEKDGLFDYPLSAPEIEGFLWKRSDRFYAWNRRWCVVANHCLYYFYHKNDKSPRGVIPLETLAIRPLDRRGRFRFEITAASPCDLPWATAVVGESTVDDQSSIFALSLPADSLHSLGLSSIPTSAAQATITSLSSLVLDHPATLQPSPCASASPSASAILSPSPRRASLPLIKSAKYVGGQLVEGKRVRYLFQCASQEERDKWVQALRRCNRIPSAFLLAPSPRDQSRSNDAVASG